MKPIVSIQVIQLSAVLIVVFSTIVSIESRSTRRSNYDEPCNKTVKCKSQSWLGCDSGTGKCLCMKPDEMTYDKTKEKCVALLGERCKFGFDLEEDRSSWFEKAECVSGATCGPSGICSCPSGSYENVNQTACQPVKEYGDKCISKFECNQDKFLSCKDGVCRCDMDTAIHNPQPFSYYDNNYGTVNVPADICVGRVGAECSHSLNKYCIQTALCNRDTQVCECSSSFTPTSDLLCGLGYDQPCMSKGNASEYPENVCSDQLVCTGNYSQNIKGERMITSTMCKCPNPEFQSYDTTLKSCVGRVGSPCRPNQKASCIPQASCMEKDNIFLCECDTGYVVTKSLLCQKAYGQSCDDGGQQKSIQWTDSCDEVPSLKCINSTCRCPNEIDVYEGERRHCSTPVGFTCIKTFDCVNDANCEVAIEGFPGRCVCKKGFHVGRKGSCEPDTTSTVPSVMTEERKALINTEST